MQHSCTNVHQRLNYIVIIQVRNYCSTRVTLRNGRQSPQMNVEEANVGRPRMYDEALRERLIEEARSMLSSDGYHGVSLRVLTRNVGTSTNAVYTLFGSKEALMAEGVVRDLEEKLGSKDYGSHSEDVKADLLEFARTYRKHATDDPRTFHGTFEAMEEARRPGSLTDRINPEVKTISSKLYEPIFELCERIAAELPDLNLEPRHMATALWAVIHGFIGLEIAGALPVDSEESELLFDKSIEAMYLGWTMIDDNTLDADAQASGKLHHAVKVADTEAKDADA